MSADINVNLFDLIRMEARCTRLLVLANQIKAAGDLVATRSAYKELTAALHDQLAATERFNLNLSTGIPMDVLSIVNRLLDALLIFADVAEAQADTGAAKQLRAEAEALSARYLAPNGIAERQRQLAGVLLAEGRFHEGLTTLIAARDLFESKGQTVDAAMATAHLASYFEWLGDYERALKEAAKAQELLGDKLQAGVPRVRDIWSAFLLLKFDKAKDLAKLMQISSEIVQVRARSEVNVGRYDEAERIYETLYVHTPKVAKPAIRLQISVIRIQQHRYGDALALIDELEPQFIGLLRPKLPVLLRAKAEALLGQGQAREARAAIEEALRAHADYPDPETLWKAHWLRARILEQAGEPEKALDAYAQSAEMVNQLRRAPLGWRLDNTYLKNKLPVFRGGIHLAAELGNAEVCCRLMEMVKSHMLTAALGVPQQSSPDLEGSGLGNQLAARIDKLSSDLDTLAFRIHQEGFDEKLEQTRQALLGERTGLLERLHIEDPRWRAVTAPVPFDLPALQATLKEQRQAAVSVYLDNGSLIGVLITPDGLRVATCLLLEGSAAAIKDYVTNFLTTKYDARQFDPALKPALQLESLVAPALLDIAVDYTSLLIVPHGPLHLLPWSALVFRGKRLFEALPVGVLPNLSCITALHGGLAERPQAAVFGAPNYDKWGLPPLDGALDELDMIAELYEDTTGLLAKPQTGQAATESAYWQLVGQPHPSGALLHLACHARFEAEEPQHSGLQLTDGQVDASEIARGPMSFNEVVLSACSTGQRALSVQGIDLLGDDILGLPGAFLEAGVRSVLVSIPPANDDASMRFMTLYHEERSSGALPLAALQRTQKKMLSDGLYESHLWVGFTLYGCQ